jgi:hypothetical protein
MSGHSHGASPSAGGIMGGGQVLGMLDTSAMLKLDFPLALARFLGSSMDPNGFNVMHTVDGGLCKDCTVLSVKMDVVFENGTRAEVSNGVYLHHIFSMNIVPDRKLKTTITNMFAPFCGGGNQFIGSIMDSLLGLATAFTSKLNVQIFGFGAVDEFRQLFTAPDGKFDSGFYFGQTDKLFFQAEVVNYRKEPQKLFLQFDVEHVPGKAGKDAMTTFLSTTGI